MFKKIMFVCTLVVLPVSAVAATTHATMTRAVAAGIGPRLGFSSSPDQFIAGGQVVIGEVAPNLTFDPNLEIGVGDHLTDVNFSFDLHYHIDTRTTWRPYVGAGATLSVVNFDNDFYGDRESETDAGGSFIFGAGVPTASGSRFFTELKLGFGDFVPSFKMLAGWNFRM